MKPYMVALLASVFALGAAPADAQKPMRVRGTITAVDAGTLALKSIDGKNLRLKLTDKTTVAAAKAITLEDLKAGDYVGSTAKKGSDGRLVASEVHTIARAVKEGHGPWDMGPGTTMTNANVAKVVKTAGGHELTLEYSGGSQTIQVPPGTPIVTTTAADRSFLKVGEYVFVAAQAETEGAITALRIQVSHGGVKPPQ